VLQPCVSFNKLNTHAWYKKRCQILPPEYDPTNFESTLRVAFEWGEKIPLGLIYRNERTVFEDRFSALDRGPLVGQGVDLEKLTEIMEEYR